MLEQIFKEAIELGHGYNDSGVVFFIEKDKVVKTVADWYGETDDSYFETSLDVDFFKKVLGEYEGILVNIYDKTVEPVIDTWDGWVNDAPDVPLV